MERTHFAELKSRDLAKEIRLKEINFAKIVKILVCIKVSLKIGTTNFNFPQQYFQMTLNKSIITKRNLKQFDMFLCNK